MFDTITITIEWNPADVPRDWTASELRDGLLSGFDEEDAELDVTADPESGRLVADVVMTDPPDDGVLPGFIESLIRRYLENKLRREAQKVGRDTPFDVTTSVEVT